MLTRAALVGVGAGAGSVCRYWVGLWLLALVGPTFPAGTLVVNVTGSFLLAFLFTANRRALDQRPRYLLGTGFCGGYTTFSFFAYETVVLLERQAVVVALLNVAANVLLSLLAVALGFWLARRLG